MLEITLLRAAPAYMHTEYNVLVPSNIGVRPGATLLLNTPLIMYLRKRQEWAASFLDNGLRWVLYREIGLSEPPRCERCLCFGGFGKVFHTASGARCEACLMHENPKLRSAHYEAR